MIQSFKFQNTYFELDGFRFDILIKLPQIDLKMYAYGSKLSFTKLGESVGG